MKQFLHLRSFRHTKSDDKEALFIVVDHHTVPKCFVQHEQITYYVIKKSGSTGSQMLDYKFLKTIPTQANLLSCPEMVSSLHGRYFKEFGKRRTFFIDLCAILKQKMKL